MKSILNDIFNELITKYKKFFSTQSDEDSTKETATNRLRFVLMHDRTNLSPEIMEKMRDELLDVISKYVIVDTEALDLNLAAEGDAIALLASIPIVRAKTQEEREEAIRELEAKKQAETEAESDEEAEEESEVEDKENEETAEDEAEETDASEDEAEIEDAIGEDLESIEEAEEKKKSSK